MRLLYAFQSTSPDFETSRYFGPEPCSQSDLLAWLRATAPDRLGTLPLYGAPTFIRGHPYSLETALRSS